jgi:hypothetical protein
MPNVARRLLEAFLAFRKPDRPGDLWHQMQELSHDEVKKVRILRFLHAHSHNGEVGEPEHDLSILSETQPVLQDLLALMKAEDPQHFAAMESLVAPGTNAEEGGEA